MGTTTTTSLPSKQELLVTGLEDVPKYEAFGEFDGEMYSGLLPCMNDREGLEECQMMFWLFEPATQEIEESMIIWLNGGPGCSSFNCGVLMEISPVTQPQHAAGYCCLPSQPAFRYNNHTWARSTTLLFVEQPIGTGFSYGTPYPQDEHDVAHDLDAFLQNFYQVFPHLQTYDFFVMGESYAGMFIPAVARHIHHENQRAIAANDDSRFLVPLKGAALGNGWIEARTQGPAVIDYSWWHGLIDKPTRDALQTEWNNCMTARALQLDRPQPPPFHKFNIQDDCAMMWGVLVASGFPNAYDITTWDPNVDQVTFASEVFYNNELVKERLHAPEGIVWHGCRIGEGRRRLDEDGRRHLYMDNDRPWSVVPYIADLVDDGIPVLVYNGDRDMTTNMVGTELALNDMEWSGKDKWLDASRGLWMVNDKQAGWSKELGNLTFVTVYNSGHMVPYNVPDSAYDLLNRLLLHKSFIDNELPTIRVKPIGKNPSSTSPTESLLQFDALEGLSTSTGDNMAYNANVVVVAVVSMVFGFVLALALVHRRVAPNRGYERVPDADTTRQ